MWWSSGSRVSSARVVCTRRHAPVPVGRSVLGFANHSQARQGRKPNRVHVGLFIGPCCGLDVHLRLLSTPPLGGAVTLGFRVQTKPWQGLAPCRLNQTLAGARVRRGSPLLFVLRGLSLFLIPTPPSRNK